jgi:hypothetical protein
MSLPTVQVFSKQNGRVSYDYISLIIYLAVALNSIKEIVLLEQVILLIVNNLLITKENAQLLCRERDKTQLQLWKQKFYFLTKFLICNSSIIINLK